MIPVRPTLHVAETVREEQQLGPVTEENVTPLVWRFHSAFKQRQLRVVDPGNENVRFQVHPPLTAEERQLWEILTRDLHDET